MSTLAAPPETTDHAAWAQAVLRRQVGALEDLAQLGLRLAQAVTNSAVEAGGAAPAEAALAFSRVSRAVRMTALLQSRLIKDISEALNRDAFNRQCDARRVEDARDEAREDRSVRVQTIVARVARSGGADEDEVQGVIDEAAERLDSDDIYGDVLARPVPELVALICRDLGLKPDWEKLGQEAWMTPSTSSRPLPFLAENGRGGPLAERSAEPMVVRAGDIHALKQGPPQSDGIEQCPLHRFAVPV